MEQGTPRMTILTRYHQAKLLDSVNWGGGSDKHFSIFLSKLTKPMKRLHIYWHKSRWKAQVKCDGTRRRTGGEVMGKLANGVGSQYPSHYLGAWCIQHYYRWCAHLGCQYSTDVPADLNGRVRFAERRNLVSARVPSHFNRSLHRPTKECCEAAASKPRPAATFVNHVQNTIIWGVTFYTCGRKLSRNNGCGPVSK
jgi:hypothetical protein